MEARAITRYVRVSPRKARIVLDQIRGKNVVKAQETLRFTNRAVAEIIEFGIPYPQAHQPHHHHRI